MIVLPDPGTAMADELKETIFAVNKMTVDPADRLTWQAYHYDKDTHTFETAISYENKIMMGMENEKAMMGQSQEMSLSVEDESLGFDGYKMS